MRWQIVVMVCIMFFPHQRPNVSPPFEQAFCGFLLFYSKCPSIVLDIKTGWFAGFGSFLFWSSNFSCESMRWLKWNIHRKKKTTKVRVFMSKDKIVPAWSKRSIRKMVLNNLFHLLIPFSLNENFALVLIIRPASNSKKYSPFAPFLFFLFLSFIVFRKNLRDGLETASLHNGFCISNNFSSL